MKEAIQLIKKQHPLIHHITNDVVENFTANGVLAFGASPVMAKEITEVEEMATIADGLLLNIGTATREEIDAMVLAGIAANKKGIPVVLDPVGISASRFRQVAVQRLLDAVNFTAIKGNAGEIAYLVDVSFESRGVDAVDQPLDDLITVAKEAAQTFETLIIITGKHDVIAYRDDILVNESGHKLLTYVTGSGCLLGSIVTACLAAQPHSQLTLLDCAYSAVHFYGRAAEVAINHPAVSGPGTFVSHFLDALQGDFL